MLGLHSLAYLNVVAPQAAETQIVTFVHVSLWFGHDVFIINRVTGIRHDRPEKAIRDNIFLVFALILEFALFIQVTKMGAGKYVFMLRAYNE